MTAVRITHGTFWAPEGQKTLNISLDFSGAAGPSHDTLYDSVMRYFSTTYGIRNIHIPTIGISKQEPTLNVKLSIPFTRASQSAARHIATLLAWEHKLREEIPLEEIDLSGHRRWPQSLQEMGEQLSHAVNEQEGSPPEHRWQNRTFQYTSSTRLC